MQTKKLIFVFLMFLSGVLQAQKINFKPMRYDEDYRYLATDTSTWYNRFKFVPLSPDKKDYLSLGGEFRTQYFKYTNPEWGDALQDKDGFTLARYLFHADLHLGKGLRAFVQLQSGLSNGEIEASSPVNENPLDLHQAFVDVNLPLNKVGLVLRLGRQEMSYGSQRIVSVREAPNNRQSFDGAKVIMNIKKLRLDAFFTNYVQAKKGIFDDGFSNGTRFWGAYGAFSKLLPFDNLDLYYFGYKKESSAFDDGKGQEMRHSLGIRTTGTHNGFQYDAEGLYQFGKFAGNDISAWTVSTHLSYTFAGLLYQPKMGFKTEVISGDRNYGDGKMNTFNPLFPRGGYFGLAALIGPANLFDVHPYLEIKLSKTLTLGQDYDVFWRMQRNDGIYAVNGRMLYSGKNTQSKYIGAQLGSSIEYLPISALYFRAEYTWFNSGKYLMETSTGSNISMFGITATFRF
ncbi:alginate export family protein [Pedobacter metabolipauper]|uniref:Alginate export protein n=1 Tax=Pedobacter metabolipauper TaxID=425513 RepID=A0A4R6T144_9SPHI|nr:alginate export family protein [Pedobacter metabolipauper]TDQ12117.1 alginate export protein [Pedobacter metabolipauper]